MSNVLPPFALARPASVAEALALLDEDATAYWGGTEVLLAMKFGLLQPSTLVDLKGIPELTGVSARDNGLVIGAGTTHAQLVSNPVVQERLPFLADVERRVGNPRVRVQGSIGGNLCFADPKSDVITALVALDATASLVGPQGSRHEAIASFINGPYETLLRADELLLDVTIPVRAQLHGAYLKYQIMERPTVAVAVVGSPESVRVVIGAAGEVPVWADAPSVWDIDVQGMVDALEPLPDTSGSEEYKRHVATVYTRRARDQFVDGAR